MVLSMLLQNFNFRLDDPGYTLRIKQNLTIKPANLKIRSSLRHGMSAGDLDRVLHARSQPSAGLTPSPVAKKLPDEKTAKDPTLQAGTRSMTILYGSNTGTCQTFAERLALNAAALGFETVVKDMDMATGQVPKSQPIIIITASYEGLPPDNAGRFIGWLKSLDGRALDEVNYAVFGCGHSTLSTSSLRMRF
jgi:cytochrome P450/NADPH-cytochrome P450 reductase